MWQYQDLNYPTPGVPHGTLCMFWSRRAGDGADRREAVLCGAPDQEQCVGPYYTPNVVPTL